MLSLTWKIGAIAQNVAEMGNYKVTIGKIGIARLVRQTESHHSSTESIEHD
jgi:hypothetical protein